MFNLGMSLTEMDKALYDKSQEQGYMIEEIIRMLGTTELKSYIEICKKEKNLNEADFAWVQKVGRIAFEISVEYQNRQSRQVFLDL
ncbi:hypothetical protein NXZ75_10335 [Lysinibacillus sphaericus]|uniref:hypothetical protein n=1 Tax=Lysinibacillus sphaericus TaxID=1421 RepID=UPI0021627610|nr:hypothetical protein [Lysinibacillus sphaericus]MCS1382591.1 hypothetical protein [Lysinibacillus sphaericus]